METIDKVCDFDYSAPDFFTKFVVDRHKWVAKPCTEFAATYLTHGLLLFLSIISIFHVSRSFRIPSESVRIVIACRLFVIFSTTTIMFIYVILGIFSSVTLPTLLLTEYGMVAFTWFVYAGIWIMAIEKNKLFGWNDIHCFGIEFIVFLQFLNVLLQIYEKYKYRSLRADPDFESLLDDNDDPMQLPEDADEGAGIFSSIFFCWVNRLIMKGFRGGLRNVDSLFRVPPSMRVEKIENDFFGNAPNEQIDQQEFSLSIGLLRTFGLSYFSLGILRFLADTFNFSGPILLHLLVTTIQSGDTENMGFVYASLMLLFAFLSAVCDFNFNFYLNKIALKVRAATLVAIYDKLLCTCEFQRSSIGTGQLLNYFSTDLDRIVSFVTSFHAFWSMPFVLCVSLYLLYREVGWAFLAGLLCAILMVPLNKIIATQIGKMSILLMHFKDERLKLVTEVIRSIRTVKVSNWEAYFEARINEIRKQELKYLKWRKYLDAICVYLWASTPLIIIIAILTTYTLIMEQKLSPAKVFTTLALINLFNCSVQSYPWVVNSLIEAFVSKKRIDKFLKLAQILPAHLYSLTDSPEQLLTLENADFRWSDNGFSVGTISVTGNKGMIIGVGGGVAAGKSTLLMGILGEAIAPQDNERSVLGVPLKTTIRIRQTTVHEGFGYVGHDSWVQRGTIRDNILCGSRMNADFYRQVLDATALSRDIEKMPGGDQYVISDDGTTISGGQRARLALARCLYHENDVVLLDDPFAALDRKVGRYIWKHAIEKLMKDRGRLVILASHDSELIRQTDVLIRLDNHGRVVSNIGKTSDVFQHPRHIPRADLADIADSEIVGPSQLSTSGSGKLKAGDQSLVSESSLASSFQLVDSVENVPEVNVEQSETGTVRIDVYWSYLRAVGFALSGAVIFALISMQTSKNLSDVWLSNWTKNATQMNGSESFTKIFFTNPQPVSPFVDDADREQTRYYLTVLLALFAFNSCFTLLRAFLFAYGGVVAAKNMHQSLLSRVLTSTVSWWDSTPFGRVVNRLCADVYMVDDSLPFQLNIVLATAVNLAGALILSVVALPFLLFVVILLFIIYYFIQRYYRFTTCEVKRITSITLSPLHGLIIDTINGLVTIKAFRFQSRFMEKLRVLLENNLNAQYTNIAASSWLSVRLQLLGILMVTAVSFTAVIQSKFFHVESGLVGLAVAYALSLTGLLNNILSSFIETEKELISVERIADYIQNIPKEESTQEAEQFDRFLYCRTIKGQIDFASVSLRYSANMPLALSNVSFHIDPGQRVAIIGRTGAGKSSLFQALLRAHPLETGKIFVDQTIDISNIDPHAARSLFGVVSQTPFLFSGTIRDNLRMNNDVSDDEINHIVEQAGLTTWLERAGGLDAQVEAVGANFSYGEKQILCICRLILSRPQIVLIDEASAHMDDETHIVVNQLIRSILSTATVLSIVHRTVGLEDFDWIIEMANGTIVKQGTPELFDCQPRRPRFTNLSVQMCLRPSQLAQAKRATRPAVVYLAHDQIVWVDEEGVGWEHRVYGDTHVVTNTRGERWEAMNSFFKLNQNYKREAAGLETKSQARVTTLRQPTDMEFGREKKWDVSFSEPSSFTTTAATLMPNASDHP
ncbi:hypothetical protein M3Y98_00183300 [Aphelenchoides besseyi]|nr:hypothetical protein M3Y98_00183300 [Aphelenchoides besseyi]